MCQAVIPSSRPDKCESGINNVTLASSRNALMLNFTALDKTLPALVYELCKHIIFTCLDQKRKKKTLLHTVECPCDVTVLIDTCTSFGVEL